MKNLIKVFCLCICMMFCLTACGEDEEAKKIAENRQKIEENELRMQELEEEDNTEESDVSEEVSEEVSVEDNVEEDVTESDISSEGLDLEESNDNDIVTGFISQSDFEKMILQYISCTSDTLDLFVESYCISDVSLLYDSECVSSNINYSAREVSDDVENYSYIVSFRAEYSSNNGSEYKSGVLRVYLSNNKVKSIEVESFM